MGQRLRWFGTLPLLLLATGCGGDYCQSSKRGTQCYTQNEVEGQRPPTYSQTPIERAKQPPTENWLPSRSREYMDDARPGTDAAPIALPAGTARSLDTSPQASPPLPLRAGCVCLAATPARLICLRILCGE